MNVTPRSPSLMLVACIAIVLFGCGPCGGGGEEEEPQPSADTIYADAVLPFAVDPGVERMRQLYRMPVPDDFSRREDEPGLLIGVAAAPDYAAVAFPSSDRQGYDIATVAVGEDWQRAELNDLDVEAVGAVAAAQTRDGEVLFAFRDRKPPHAISLWSWSPDGGPKAIDFSRPQAANFPEHSESCPDIDVAIDDDGGIDLVYRQSLQDIRYARLDAGATSWQDVSIIEGDRWLETVPAGFDIGCSMRVEHDEGDVPNVLAWVRDTSTEGVGESVAEDTLNGRNVGWFRTVTGDWEPTRWRYAAGVNPRVFGAQGFDMVTVGRDHLLVGGISFTERNEGQAPPNVLSTTARPWLIPEGQGRGEDRDLFPFADAEPCTDSYPLAGEASYGFSLMRTGLGAVASYHPSQWQIQRVRGCKPHTGIRVPLRPAPVHMHESQQGVRSPTAANGTRPYDLVMCIDEEQRLVVCAGGARVADSPESPLFSIVDGWSDTLFVAAGAQDFSLTIEQEGGDGAAPQIYVDRIDVGPGEFERDPGPTIIPPQQAGQPWLVSFTVIEGATYRMAVAPPNAAADQSQRLGGLGEVFVFGEFDRFDPREPRHHPCVDGGEVDDRGVCVARRQDPYIGESIDLPLAVNVEDGWERPQLYDSDGNMVPTDVVIEDVQQVSRWMELVPQVELEQLSTYEVRYPEGTTNMFGAPFTIDQRTFRVETRQGPLTFVESEPADGAVDVPLDTTIRVTFSGPVAFFNEGNDILLDQQVDMEITRVPITFRERPGNVFEIEPAALVPSATYTLTLTDQLRAREDGNGRPLVDAPVIIKFSTVAE